MCPDDDEDPAPGAGNDAALESSSEEEVGVSAAHKMFGKVVATAKAAPAAAPDKAEAKGNKKKAIPVAAGKAKAQEPRKVTTVNTTPRAAKTSPASSKPNQEAGMGAMFSLVAPSEKGFRQWSLAGQDRRDALG